MKLDDHFTEHFTLREFVYSQTATRLQIDNTLPLELEAAARALHEQILEPLRVAIGKPVHIDSGYRCLALNRAKGSKDNSQHVKAEAADITVVGMTAQQVCDKIVALDLPFDQLIEEFEEWTHVSFSTRNRRQALRSRHDENGEVIYDPMT